LARVYLADSTTDAIPSSEALVLGALRSLDDTWRIFHSVKWQAVRKGRQGDGEADFGLLHPQYGLLILEVKGGGVTARNGLWYSTDRFGIEHRIKNPFDQVRDSKYALVEYLAGLTPPIKHVPVNYCVVFPNVSIEHSLGPYAPRQIIWDNKDIRDVSGAIDTTLKHWGARATLTSSEVESLTSRLAPTVSIRVRLTDHIARSGETLVALTRRQIWAFSQLKSVRRAVVLGGAGTGKTVLGVERARQLARDGFVTLLTCYNELLAGRLRQQLSDVPDVTVSTFHAFCLRELGKAGKRIPREPTTDWWDATAPAMLVAALGANATVFDAVIVDEGQDFKQEWFDALLGAMTRQDSAFYVFADPHQQLYRRRWTMPSDWLVAALDLNCRNTAPIAERVAAIYNDRVDDSGATGPKPMFYEVDLQREGLDFIERFVGRLLHEEGVTPEQIVVLSDDAGLVRRLRYASAGEEPFTSTEGHGVAVETVARFKGLEADAVVLALSDASLREPESFRSTAYVGLSRPRSALFVLGSAKMRQALSWDNR
jgi:hypothetical protein